MYTLLFIFLACIHMDEHISFLKTSCRLSGNQVKGSLMLRTNSTLLKLELWLRLQINVDVDNDEIHPSVICPACKRVLYRIGGATDPASVFTSKQPFLRRRYDDQDCYWLREKKNKTKRRRPSKKKAKKPCSEIVEGSDAETRVLSGADIQKSRSSGIVMLAGT